MTTEPHDAGTPLSSGAQMMKDEEDRYRSQAMEEYCGDDLQIDKDAAVSSSEDGAWVAAWVWVQAEEEGED